MDIAQETLSRYNPVKFLLADGSIALKTYLQVVICSQDEFEKVNIVIGQENRIILKMPHIVALTLVVFLAFVVSGVTTADTMVEKSIIDRIKPFGEVNVGSAPVAAAPAAVDAKGSYMASCAACHATGAAGSPKVGDKAAWKKRIAQGMDTLDEHAINGFKGMPPRGGSSLSDDAVKAAVKYMVKNSK